MKNLLISIMLSTIIYSTAFGMGSPAEEQISLGSAIPAFLAASAGETATEKSSSSTGQKCIIEIGKDIDANVAKQSQAIKEMVGDIGIGAVVLPFPEKHQKSKRKKIIILSSNGGGGHTSAAYAIKKYLSETGSYEIEINNIVESFSSIDLFRLCSLGRYSCEDFFNFCLQKNYPRAANNFIKLNTRVQPYIEYMFDGIIDKYIASEMPDMVISVIPVINACVARVTKKYAIPFIIVPTDLDASFFMYGMKEPYNQSLKLCYSYDNADIVKTLRCGSIAPHNEYIGGFPIRPDFFEPKNIPQIKIDFNIPVNKPVILLLMGAAGSGKICTYMHKLKELAMPVHIIVCLGRLESLRNSIEMMSFPPHITTTIVSHTPRMSDLMAVADVAIIKPGSVSVNEALYMNLPTIIDNIGIPLLWEKFNIDFIKQNNFGSILNSFDEVKDLVSLYISDQTYKKKIRENITAFAKKAFGPHIKNLVYSMLESQKL